MGFLGKLFGKKGDFDFKPPKDSDLGLGGDFGAGSAGIGETPDFGSPDTRQQLPTLEPVPEQSFQQARPFDHSPQMQQPGFQQDPTYIISKNLEVISSKIDFLRASLESINQRLINLENIARGEQEPSNRYRW